MHIRTTRFGLLDIESGDVLNFSAGPLGLEDCRQWVLLADAQNDALGWLQCLARPDVALAVVSPRRFVPDYQFRVYRSDLAPLGFERVQDAQVLVIVSRNDRGITLNLKAPIVINLERRLGRRLEIVSNLIAVITRVFAVLIERHTPRNLLRHRVNLHRPANTANRGQYLTRHDSDRSMRRQSDALDPTVAVLDHSLVNMQVQYHNERP